MDSIKALLATLALEKAPRGTHILKRALPSDTVVYVEHGRVVVGVLGDAGLGAVEHELGVVQGPGWLEATDAVLHLPSAMDAVAATEVRLYHVPLTDFRAMLRGCSLGVQGMFMDMARAHRQQSELAVSRLAKDAESRCAEWLLSHATSSDKGGCAVHLQLRKRAIAAQLGIAPETLSRVLRHLRDLHLISGSGRVVDLVDPVGLRTLAGPSAPCRCGAV